MIPKMSHRSESPSSRVQLTAWKVVLVCGCAVTMVHGQRAYFDDAGAEVQFGVPGMYEVAMSKVNGAFTRWTDGVSGQVIMGGSRFDCLWGSVFPEETDAYVGGCSFASGWSNAFAYSFDPVESSILLTYTPGGPTPAGVRADVAIRLFDDAYFDLSLTLTNERASILDFALFPSDLIFAENEIVDVVYPLHPGVRLKSTFFQEDRSFGRAYPTLFSDAVFINTDAGPVSIYAIDLDRTEHFYASLAFWPDDDDVPDSSIFSHNFNVALEAGETVTLGPLRVRFRDEGADAVAHLRIDAGMDEWSDVVTKVGNVWDALRQSPLYKADLGQLGFGYDQLDSVLAGLPSPALIHPVAYWAGGFDNRYPEVLPADPQWGSDEAFRVAVANAQQRGQLVMPYFNPTWWDDEGPTLTNLPPPLTLNDVAVLNLNGSPVFESYGPNDGYVVSFASAFVNTKVQQVMDQLTGDYGFNAVFEDQIGARSFVYDTNASASGPTTYITGLMEHVENNADRLLMTERGFDRLARWEAGFCGGVLLDQRARDLDEVLGEENWEPYPLAQMLVGDKVLFYQHDLAPEVMTTDVSTLCWNIAQGHLLSYDLTAGISDPWVDIVATIQEGLVADYVGNRITDYMHLSDDVTRTSMDGWTIWRNWDQAASAVVADVELPPDGCYVESFDGRIRGGYVRSYRGASLGGADHFVIERRTPTYIELRKPIGPDAMLQVPLPEAWPAGASLFVHSVDGDGAFLSALNHEVVDGSLRFAYPDSAGGQDVAKVFVFAADCNDSDLPDALDIAAGQSPDDNANGIPDDCEIAVPATKGRTMLVAGLCLLVVGALVSRGGRQAVASRNG